MSSTTRRAVAASPAGGRRIDLVFDDGTRKTVDVSGFLQGPVFARIAADDEAFASLFLDPDLRTVCWPGDVDLAPELLETLPDVGGYSPRY